MKAPRYNPEEVNLYGGIAGCTLEVDFFRFDEGIEIRRTYAHIMAPYLMAFKRPEKSGDYHPAPLKAASGGLAIDINIELFLSREQRPTGFNRVNTLWWLLSMLRLRTGAPLRMPVISNKRFSEIADDPEEPNLWPIEMHPQQLNSSPSPPLIISSSALEWVKAHYQAAAQLMDVEPFNRAFQTFDSAVWAHTSASAIVSVWAALETLFRPGRYRITDTLCKSIATYLRHAGPERDRLYQKVRNLYDARGGSVHDSRHPAIDEYFQCFSLAQEVFIRSFEEGSLPDSGQLLIEWRHSSTV